MLPSDNEERRDFSRMDVACPASFHLEGEAKSFHAQTLDLSATGMQLIGSDAVAVGSVVHVTMRPEGAMVAPLQAKAEVVRCDMSAAGVYQLGLKIMEMVPGL